MATTTHPRARDWLAFKDIELQTGIPSTSLRRFAEKFPAFLAGKRVERAVCFPPESVPIFRRIHELFRAGKHTAEVNTILALEHVATLDVSAIPTGVTTSPTPSQPADLAPMIRDFTASVDRLTAALERQNELQARTLETMEARLVALESAGTAPGNQAHPGGVLGMLARLFKGERHG